MARLTSIAMMLASTVWLLQGCAAGVAAVAVPAAFGGAAIAGAEDRRPFGGGITYTGTGTADELAVLDAKIRRANCGDAESQYWLADTLDNGLNGTPNKIEIYKWYRLAEMGGIAPAAQKVTALDARMSRAEVTEAKARVSAWQPTTENCPPRGG
ncbi:MAG: hypothetical protein R3286_00380 [Gammaproteobacteria bacterium]|nr:hypothetical protein [Gammaproteobacteria bacterium]